CGRQCYRNTLGTRRTRWNIQGTATSRVCSHLKIAFSSTTRIGARGGHDPRNRERDPEQDSQTQEAHSRWRLLARPSSLELGRLHKARCETRRNSVII